jgi:hypothetical protein
MGMMECWKNGILGIETDNTAIFIMAFPFQEFIRMDQSHHSNIPLFHSTWPD